MDDWDSGYVHPKASGFRFKACPAGCSGFTSFFEPKEILSETKVSGMYLVNPQLAVKFDHVLQKRNVTLQVSN